MKENPQRARLEGPEIFPRCLSYNAYMRERLSAEDCLSSENILHTMSRLLAETEYPKTIIILFFILLTISKVYDDKEVVHQEKRINLTTISDSRTKNKSRLSDMRIILGDQKKCPSEKTKQMATLPCYQSHLYYTRSFGS